MNKILLLVTLVNLVACNSVLTSPKSKILSIQGNRLEKRINTTDCKDSDDWYLDGYRVGKFFNKQKNEMLMHRMAFCEKAIHKNMSEKFKKNWLAGYKVGIKKA